MAAAASDLPRRWASFVHVEQIFLVPAGLCAAFELPRIKLSHLHGLVISS
jgi:hypothetical protein